MGKTGKWIKNLLTGKKDKHKHKDHQPPIATHETPISVLPVTPKEKRRWSFRRSSATNTTPTNSMDIASTTPLEPESYERNKLAMEGAIASVDAAVAAAQEAAAMMRLTTTTTTLNRTLSTIEAVAATKIQSVFRSYLAKKALTALKGLVKLQALVRGHLVRKQATATLRCMQVLVAVQARARAQRMCINHETNPYDQMPASAYEENIKIVEMDVGQSKSNTKSTKNSQRLLPCNSPAFSELCPWDSSSHFEDFSFGTARSSPQNPSRAHSYSRPDCVESLGYEFPSYMANTESSRAKVRSQSAPKQRPVDHYSGYERQSSSVTRRRHSIEGRNVPRVVRMQRSSSHVGSGAQNYQYPWSVKLIMSSVALVGSECGSTSTVLTDANYCKSVVGYDTHGYRY